MRLTYILIILCFLISACKNSTENVEDLDLMRYGMPIKIKAPLDADIKTSDFGLMKDVTIKSEEGYDLQIFSSEASQLDPKILKSDLLRDVKKNPFFTKIILEEDQGFIFEKIRSDSSKNYDFRYVRIQGDNQFTFQAGMIGQFSEAQIKNMYNSVK